LLQHSRKIKESCVATEWPFFLFLLKSFPPSELLDVSFWLVYSCIPFYYLGRKIPPSLKGLPSFLSLFLSCLILTVFPLLAGRVPCRFQSPSPLSLPRFSFLCILSTSVVIGVVLLPNSFVYSLFPFFFCKFPPASSPFVLPFASPFSSPFPRIRELWRLFIPRLSPSHPPDVRAGSSSLSLLPFFPTFCNSVLPLGARSVPVFLSSIAVAVFFFTPPSPPSLLLPLQPSLFFVPS